MHRPCKCPKTIGAGPDSLELDVRHFSTQYLSRWVLTLLSKGLQSLVQVQDPRVQWGPGDWFQGCPEVLSPRAGNLCNSTKGAIEFVDSSVEFRWFYSTHFLVPIQFRSVLDLRPLNWFLKFLCFHMLYTADVLQVLSKGAWFTSINVKDAYFHVLVAPCCRQFLNFSFKGWASLLLPKSFKQQFHHFRRETCPNPGAGEFWWKPPFIPEDRAHSQTHVLLSDKRESEIWPIPQITGEIDSRGISWSSRAPYTALPADLAQPTGSRSKETPFKPPIQVRMVFRDSAFTLCSPGEIELIPLNSIALWGEIVIRDASLSGWGVFARCAELSHHSCQRQ